MSKNLSILQTIAKVGRIVCKVLFILCIVGASGCLVGLLSLLIFGGASVWEADMFSMFGGANFVLLGSMGCLTGLIACVGEGVLFYLAERYFAYQLEVGTPFTEEGAKKLFRLGITIFIVSASVAVLSAIVMGIFLIFSSSSDIDISSNISIGTGLFCLLLSVIFRHGAELRVQNEEMAAAATFVAEDTACEKPREESPVVQQVATEEVPAEDGERVVPQSFDVL